MLTLFCRHWYFVGLLVCLGTWGCDNSRFGVPSDMKLQERAVEKHLRPASELRIKGKQPPSRPQQIPKDLRLESVESHAAGVRSVSVDPAGELVLSAGADRQLMLWHLPSQKKVRSWRGFQQTLRRVQFSPDGRRFLLLEGKHKLSVWSTQGHLLQQQTVSEALTDVHFAPIANQLVAVSRSGLLIHFHGIHLKELTRATLCPAGQGAVRLAVDAGQRWLAVGCRGGRLVIRSWDGKQNYTVQQAAPLSALAFSPTGTHLVSATQSALQWWQISPQPLSLRKISEQQAHLRPMTQVVFHPNLPMLATTSLDRHLYLWEWQAQGITLKKGVSHSAGITALAVVPETKGHWISGDQVGHVTLWSSEGQRLMEKNPPPVKAKTLSFSSRDPFFATDTGDGGIGIWDLHKGNLWMSLNIHPFPVQHVEFARDGNRLLSVDKRNVVFWDLRTRQTIGILYAPPSSNITAAVMGRDWTEVFYGTDQKGVALWTIAGPKQLYQDPGPRCISAIAYHVSSRKGVVGTCQGMVYLYDFATYQWITTRTLVKQAIIRLQFSQDGKRLLVMTSARATLWSFPALDLQAQVTSPTSWFAGIFDPQEHVLWLGGANRTVYRWEPKSSQLQPQFEGCDTPIQNIVVSGRTPVLALSCLDGKIQLWQRPQHKHVLTWVGLPNKDWLVYTPELFFVSSQGALRHFFWGSTQGNVPLSSFQFWFYQPKQVEKQLAFQRKESP